jgi:hypothetical protein
MNGYAVELTEQERMLLERIDFKPSSEIHDADYWRAVGDAAQKLMESLLQRKAIPEVRGRFFIDPKFNIAGRGRSRAQIFEKNGTRGSAIFRHPHFLKHLHYFLFGPELPADIISAFELKVRECGDVTSSDIVPLGQLARQLARRVGQDLGKSAEEFFKLALDCGLGLSAAQSIRDAVKRAR